MKDLTACDRSWMGWVSVLTASHCLPAYDEIGIGWDRALVAVHSRTVDARMLIDCWTPLIKVLVDWAMVEMIMFWEASLVIVHCLAAREMIWRV